MSEGTVRNHLLYVELADEVRNDYAPPSADMIERDVLPKLTVGDVRHARRLSIDGRHRYLRRVAQQLREGQRSESDKNDQDDEKGPRCPACSHEWRGPGPDDPPGRYCCPQCSYAWKCPAQARRLSLPRVPLQLVRQRPTQEQARP